MPYFRRFLHFYQQIFEKVPKIIHFLLVHLWCFLTEEHYLENIVIRYIQELSQKSFGARIQNNFRGVKKFGIISFQI